MREFFDTSVLAAAFLGDHPHHDASARVFAQAVKAQSACAAHSLAELYAILTALPIKPMIAPEQALLFLENVRERLSVLSLSAEDYDRVIRRAADRRVSGGRIYDALLLYCAEKSSAKTIYTWNLKHFKHLAPDMADRIKSPSPL